MDGIDGRVSGDRLLDAQDLIETVREVGGEVDERGYITVYHRTTAERAAQIRSSGKMVAKEDGLFFSVNPNGQDNQGYSDVVLAFRIPAEKLVLDDIFADDASVRLPLGNKRRMDVSEFLVEDESGGVDWAGNRGTMFSPAEEEDGVDRIGNREEAATQNETSPHPSPAATPSPQGEGSGGRPMTAPTEATEAEDAVGLAREKKEALAKKVGIDGLKSRIKSAEERQVAKITGALQNRSCSAPVSI